MRGFRQQGPLHGVVPVDQQGAGWGQREEAVGRGPCENGIIGIGKTFGGLRGAVDRIDGKNRAAAVRQGEEGGEVARSVAGGGDQGQALADRGSIK